MLHQINKIVVVFYTEAESAECMYIARGYQMSLWIESEPITSTQRSKNSCETTVVTHAAKLIARTARTARLKRRGAHNSHAKIVPMGMFVERNIQRLSMTNKARRLAR